MPGEHINPRNIPRTPPVASAKSLGASKFGKQFQRAVLSESRQNSTQNVSARSPDLSPKSGQSAGQKKRRKDFTSARGHTINPPMNMERRYILLVATLVFALANWLPNELLAEDLQQAK